MKLLHHPEVELSRALLAALPQGAQVVVGDGGHPVSAYPSVVVDVPAYVEKRPAFNEAGELTGMEDFLVPGHEEVLRLPASWQAVDSYLAFALARAAASPPPGGE